VRAIAGLPLGNTKVMDLDRASGDVSATWAVKDIVMFPSIVEVAVINRSAAKC